MPVIVTLDVMLARRKMKARELAARIGLSETQLSLLRTDKVRGIRFGTLARICAVLECTPADLLAYTYDPADLDGSVPDSS